MSSVVSLLFLTVVCHRHFSHSQDVAVYCAHCMSDYECVLCYGRVDIDDSLGPVSRCYLSRPHCDIDKNCCCAVCTVCIYSVYRLTWLLVYLLTLLLPSPPLPRLSWYVGHSGWTRWLMGDWLCCWTADRQIADTGTGSRCGHTIACCSLNELTECILLQPDV